MLGIVHCDFYLPRGAPSNQASSVCADYVPALVYTAFHSYRTLSVCVSVTRPWALASGCASSLLEPARVKIARIGYGFPITGACNFACGCHHGSFRVYPTDGVTR